MRRSLSAFLLLAACQPQGWETSLPKVGACFDGPLPSLVGRPVATLPPPGPGQQRRILHPGEAGTMDYAATRLTLLVDAQDRITDARCE